jgi:protein-tyrosine phosphatase
LETLPRPIFIHCQHGEDRTGTIVACWRMNHNWSSMMAMAEAGCRIRRTKCRWSHSSFTDC